MNNKAFSFGSYRPYLMMNMISDPIIILLSVLLTKLHQRNLRQPRVSNINQNIFKMMITITVYKKSNQYYTVIFWVFWSQIFNTVYVTILESSNGNVCVDAFFHKLYAYLYYSGTLYSIHLLVHIEYIFVEISLYSDFPWVLYVCSKLKKVILLTLF